MSQSKKITFKDETMMVLFVVPRGLLLLFVTIQSIRYNTNAFTLSRLGSKGLYNLPSNKDSNVCGKQNENASHNSHSSHSQFEKAGGILYRTSVFNLQELSDIQTALTEYKRRLVDETASSVAKNRRGAVLPPQSKVNQIFREGSLIEWIRKVTNNPNYILRDDVIPVEIRSYEQKGACMAWHSDDVLFQPPQLEIVWTLENSSDCVTMWKIDGDIRTVETDPNSVLLIGAGGPEHCVTSLKQGSRFIIKCVYAFKDATYQNDAVHQFAEKKGSRNKSKRDKRKK